MVKAKNIEDQTQRQILDIIVAKDDVSWKNLIFGLIESEQMDPWDINISLIAGKFLEELKKLKEMDFRIGGKVVLASAILLKLKTERLRDEELEALDTLIRSADEPVDLGLDELQSFEEPEFSDRPKLVPRSPQPRKRKVSVYDLVDALEKALESEARRPEHLPARTLDTIDPPEHHIDISVIIREVYDRIYGHYEVQKADGKLMFHEITRSTDPKDMVMTFIPLLHLENARKVDMEQAEHFGPIGIHLIDRTPPQFIKEQTKVEHAGEKLKEHMARPRKAKLGKAKVIVKKTQKAKIRHAVKPKKILKAKPKATVKTKLISRRKR
jgi:segregation and condensation protein A